jgi:hypothetical protein
VLISRRDKKKKVEKGLKFSLYRLFRKEFIRGTHLIKWLFGERPFGSLLNKKNREIEEFRMLEENN